MPTAETALKENNRLRIFAYGPAKSKKTWWALKAAEAGYRVLMFSLERGHGIVQQISPEARERIYILDAHDGPTDGYASLFTSMALREYNFYADEARRRVSAKPMAGMEHIDMRGFGADTVIVIDTYTALAISAMRQFSYENNIDLADASKTEWEGYGFSGRMLTWMLVQMRSLPCHVVCIGHATQYDKFKKGTRGKPSTEIEWSRRQPISSSNPHGMTIARDWDHVLYFSIEGRTCWIDTRGNRLEDAGSRALAPDRYNWDELTFGALASMAHVQQPDNVAPFDFPLVEGNPAIGNSPIKPMIGQVKQSVTKRTSILNLK